MSQQKSEVIETARSYYNSEDAHTFYTTIWGGEDLHVGTYRRPDESIFDASRRTVKKLAGQADKLDQDSTVLDLGSGIGGSARYLARTYGCQVVALNLSEVENERNRRMSAEQGLDHLIDVVDGNFENVPYPDGSFDLVWSQDAILHSPNRKQVLAEAYRVLKKGGEMVFTDPMQTEDCFQEYLDPILKRIHLASLSSPTAYCQAARELGFQVLSYDNQPQQLTNHYGAVREEMLQRTDELRQNGVSDDYIKHMDTGLQNWVMGGKYGHLTWGFFHFKKP
jgi:sarcosine/dimethylglycine N-methyltransferase